jgi:hypothetical protein
MEYQPRLGEQEPDPMREGRLDDAPPGSDEDEEDTDPFGDLGDYDDYDEQDEDDEYDGLLDDLDLHGRPEP